MKTTVTVKPLECCHADTCFPCYWSGYHLPHVQIPVWRGMTLAEMQKAREYIANAATVTQYDRAKKRAAYMADLIERKYRRT